MSDLISKSKVIELLYKVFDEYRIATDKTSTLGGFGSEVFKRVREMPTVYDIDKVVMEYGVAFKELDCSKHDKKIYNKAIDDFVNNIKDELNCFEVKNLDTCVLFDFIDRKAKQLKEGN